MPAKYPERRNCQLGGRGSQETSPLQTVYGCDLKAAEKVGFFRLPSNAICSPTGGMACQEL